eukprot:CAMPEP_0184979656 /NCGR_PEP_ID=MMETSP1098-20130426/9855_1 /TAXON_ID=89044 /ORGANISM="Spumella elongata, Strain CCAP 955/1" /LENGTH=185 /DNA_ID=CAMNT_0027502985 /DNA_START=116 /DNA_END=673 /DNA_ORIENTATION=+
MPLDSELHKAAHKGDLETCKMLIESSVDEEVPITVNDAGASDRRPLHRAAGAGHLALCTYFLDIGAEIDAVDKSGRTALHWAAISGNTEIVELLLAKGANILAETLQKTNVLHSAVEANRIDTVKALMNFVAADEEKKTALTMGKNAEEKTPWDIAAAAKNSAICTILKELGDANGASSAACSIS